MELSATRQHYLFGRRQRFIVVLSEMHVYCIHKSATHRQIPNQIREAENANQPFDTNRNQTKCTFDYSILIKVFKWFCMLCDAPQDVDTNFIHELDHNLHCTGWNRVFNHWKRLAGFCSRLLSRFDWFSMEHKLHSHWLIFVALTNSLDNSEYLNSNIYQLQLISCEFWARNLFGCSKAVTHKRVNWTKRKLARCAEFDRMYFVRSPWGRQFQKLASTCFIEMTLFAGVKNSRSSKGSWELNLRGK